MNKKLILPIVVLSLLVVGVSAVLVDYFGQRETTIEVELPIEVQGDTTETILDGMGCEQVEGSDLTIVNKANVEIDVGITSTEEEGVETSYIGTLELSQKIVNFDLDVWELTGNTATVEYTLVGDSFSAKVVEEDEIEGYILIYYKDNSDRFNEPATARTINQVIASEKNLPYSNDGNAEYDYCATGEYDTCHGAKLWYVPSDAITDGEIDWGRASEFLFETELIQYNSDGIITMYPESELGFYPLFDLDCMLEGTVVINTTVDMTEV